MTTEGRCCLVRNRFGSQKGQNWLFLPIALAIHIEQTEGCLETGPHELAGNSLAEGNMGGIRHH